MFVTYENFRSAVPDIFNEEGQLQWECVELSLSVPWFIVALGHFDFGEETVSSRTWCVGSVNQLKSVLTPSEYTFILSLTCVRPTGFNRPGFWEYIDIATVWEVEDGTTQALEFVSREGESFTVGPVFEESMNPTERRLVAEIPKLGYQVAPSVP